MNTSHHHPRHKGLGVVPGLQKHPRSIQNPSIVDRGGLVLDSAKLHLWFFGDQWKDNNFHPNPFEISNIINDVILPSNYFAGLAQYRNIAAPTIPAGEKSGRVPSLNLALSTVIPDEDPSGYCITGFFEDAFHEFGITGFGPQDLHIAFLFRGYTFAPPNDMEVGYHTTFTYLGQIVNYGVIQTTNPSSITEIFSHELVEAMTDPRGDGFRDADDPPGTNNSWTEIADVNPCHDTNFTLPNSSTSVQTYWDQANKKCFPR